jgi:predicted CoA-binding protein
MKRTLVLGASEKTWRYSNMAIKRLVFNNYPVVAIGKNNGKVGDVDIISDKFLFEDIDTVTMYLNTNNQREYYNYIVSLKPKRVIFNPGSENSELYEILEFKDIEVLEACTLVLLSANQY